MKRRSRLAIALLALAALAGCQSNKSTTSPAPLQDAILITNITPAVGASFKPGDHVTFVAAINYRLISSATGTLTLSAADPGGTTLPNGLAKLNIVTGEASATLSISIVVPTGINLIQVIASVNPTNNPNQITQSNINYPVTN